MKKINKKKLLVIALIIFLIVGIVGITNLISYAQNANTVSQEENSKTDYAKVQISFENNYEYIVGDNIKIAPKNITITGMNILIGSTISTKKIKKNGLINGGIVGLVYIIFLYIVSSMCLVGFTPSMNSLIMLGVGIITGMVGRNNWSEFV